MNEDDGFADWAFEAAGQVMEHVERHGVPITWSEAHLRLLQEAGQGPARLVIEDEAELLEKQQLAINYHNCRSWHLGVETSNIINFQTVPANCIDYVEDYLTSDQYRADSKTVCKEAYFYAKGLALKNDTVNVWIFDLDETLLSNVPFYAQYGYGYTHISINISST